MRIAGSLKLGTVTASEFVRTLHSGSRTSTIAAAIAELGRIAKSLSLLSYVDDAAHRRRILVQLNRHEKRHELSRKVFHGQRGEVRKRYREGQEDQLGALGLVVNAVCLFNSLYLDESVHRLREGGEAAAEEDLARVSPLAREHVRVLGRYHFTPGRNSDWRRSASFTGSLGARRVRVPAVWIWRIAALTPGVKHSRDSM